MLLYYIGAAWKPESHLHFLATLLLQVWCSEVHFEINCSLCVLLVEYKLERNNANYIMTEACIQCRNVTPNSCSRYPCFNSVYFLSNKLELVSQKSILQQCIGHFICMLHITCTLYSILIKTIKSVGACENCLHKPFTQSQLGNVYEHGRSIGIHI